jgi:molybdate transport system substrate-binding protein
MQALRLMFCLGLAVVCAGDARAAQVRLFAAASLADAVQAITPGFTAATGHTVQLNFGASGLLARQIRDGAPADVFFSADALWVDQLETEGFVLPDTRRTLLTNQLVLIAPFDGGAVINAFADLSKSEVRRIAIGEPATVPAGRYARQHLEAQHLWDAVAPKLIPLDNVRAVLAAVAAGNADAGIVYRTDALIEKRVRVVVTVAVADGPRIAYPAVVLKEAAAPEAARALLGYLAGDVAQAILVRHGFLPHRNEP